MKLRRREKLLGFGSVKQNELAFFLVVKGDGAL